MGKPTSFNERAWRYASRKFPEHDSPQWWPAYDGYLAGMQCERKRCLAKRTKKAKVRK